MYLTPIVEKMYFSLVIILVTSVTLVYQLVDALQVVPETFPAHTSYLRSPRIVNPRKYVHPQHRALYDVVHARLPDYEADRVKGWKNVLEGRKHKFNSKWHRLVIEIACRLGKNST